MVAGLAGHCLLCCAPHADTRGVGCLEVGRRRRRKKEVGRRCWFQSTAGKLHSWIEHAIHVISAWKRRKKKLPQKIAPGVRRGWCGLGVPSLAPCCCVFVRQRIQVPFPFLPPPCAVESHPLPDMLLSSEQTAEKNWKVQPVCRLVFAFYFIFVLVSAQVANGSAFVFAVKALCSAAIAAALTIAGKKRRRNEGLLFIFIVIFVFIVLRRRRSVVGKVKHVRAGSVLRQWVPNCRCKAPHNLRRHHACINTLQTLLGKECKQVSQLPKQQRVVRSHRKVPPAFRDARNSLLRLRLPLHRLSKEHHRHWSKERGVRHLKAVVDKHLFAVHHEAQPCPRQLPHVHVPPCVHAVARDFHRLVLLGDNAGLVFLPAGLDAHRFADPADVRVQSCEQDASDESAIVLVLAEVGNGAAAQEAACCDKTLELQSSALHPHHGCVIDEFLAAVVFTLRLRLKALPLPVHSKEHCVVGKLPCCERCLHVGLAVHIAYTCLQERRFQRQERCNHAHRLKYPEECSGNEQLPDQRVCGNHGQHLAHVGELAGAGQRTELREECNGIGNGVAAGWLHGLLQRSADVQLRQERLRLQTRLLQRDARHLRRHLLVAQRVAVFGDQRVAEAGLRAARTPAALLHA
eukprot:Rhum_TRINITY_DN12097_c0_g1::Rhum_TRINITY_DN12097_c0_g1_i1::g.49202::m.49202